MRKTSSKVASSPKRSTGFSPSRQRLLIALLTFSSLTSGAALAAGGSLPTGGHFVGGAGAIASSGNSLTVNQSTQIGIINWQSFSIGKGDSVSIANGKGATLNRVTGGNISTIAGSLKSTGSVYVVNQAGIVVGPGGKVVTNGSFVASTRDVANATFTAGGNIDLSGSSSGTVVNQGSITSTGGNVVLVGKSVTNSGSVSAAKGNASLVAGDDVLLQASGDDAVLVETGSGDVTNTGKVAAAQVALNAAGGNVYALAVNNGGVIRATGTKTQDGRVYLTAGDDLTVNSSVSATNADGSGGTVVATASTVNIGKKANISANGATDGGIVLIGGDRHGGTDRSIALSKAPIANASVTMVAAGAKISADAGAKGTGGNVVIWSDKGTGFAGAISAKGGTKSGNGGFVEVSGEQQLSFTGKVDTHAKSGSQGTLLLDPADVTISTTTSNDSDDGGSPTDTFNPSSGATTSTIAASAIEAALVNNNVTVTTASTGGSVGDIVVGAPITWGGTHSLELDANNTITFAALADSIIATGTGGITLKAAGGSLGTDVTKNSITIGAPIEANGGTINIITTAPIANGTGNINFTNAPNISNTTGDINFVSTAYITVNGNITTSVSGNINLVAGPESLITIGNTFKVQTAGAGSILLESDFVSLGSSPEPGESGQVITDTTLGKVTIQPVSDGPVQIGSLDPSSPLAGTNSPIVVDQDLALITTHTLVIGSDGTTAVNGFTGGHTTSITLLDNLNSSSVLNTIDADPGQVPLANVGNLALVTSTAGFVTENSAFGNFVLSVHGGTGGLAVTAGTYIDLSNSGNQVGTIAMALTGTGVASPTGTGDAAIQFAGATSGALSIATVNGVSGITATGVGSVYLQNAGAVTQNTAAANTITATSLELEGGTTAAFTLDNTLNSIGSVAGTLKSLSMHDHSDLSTATIGSSVGINATGAITVVDNGNLTIGSGGGITTTGGSVKLEDEVSFTNSDGANAFHVTGGGTWRVYSQDPTNDSDDGGNLSYSFVQYNAANSYTTPFTTADGVLTTSGATGNGFIYTIAPVLKEKVAGEFDKTYDGNVSVTGTLVSGDYTVTTGGINSDQITFTNPTGTGAGVATYADKNVANGIAISLTNPVTFTAKDAHNVHIFGYGLTVTDNLVGDIRPLAVVLTGTRIYDGLKDASGTILSVGNLIGTDVVTVASGSGTIGTKNVGSDAITSFGTLTLGGANDGNYTLVGATGTVDVTKATLTISAVTQTKTYDGNTTSTGTPTIVGLKTGDTISASTLTQAFGSKNVLGTNDSTLSVTNFTGVNDGNSGGNYTVHVNTAMGTINPLAVVLTGTRIYDGLKDASGTILSVGNLIGTDVVTVASGSGTIGTKNVGSDAITSFGTLTLGGANDGNYTLVGATGTVDVTKATLTISAVTQTKTYDGNTTSTGTPTIVGLKTGDTISASTLTQAFGSKNVLGTNGSTLSVTNFTGVNDGNSGGNYTVHVNTAMGTINPLAVVLTGTRIYDGLKDASGTILSVGNLIGTDVVTVASGSGTIGTKNVGSDAITSFGTLTLGGANDGNYTLVGATGTVDVTKATLTISAVTQTKTYDGNTTSTGTPTIVGLKTGDTISASTLTQAFGSKNVLGTNDSTLSVTNFTGVNDGNSGGNYTVHVNTAMGTINPLAVVLTGTRIYDGLKDASGTILSVGNLIGTDVVTVASGSGTIGTKNVGDDAITSFGTLTLGGANHGNYTLVGATGTVDVTKATLTISAVTQTKTYDGNTTSTGTPTIVGLKTGDTISASTLTQAFGSKNVLGTNGSTLSVTNFTGVNDGNSGGNYTVHVNTAMGTINPLGVILTGTRSYDGGVDASSSILSVTSGEITGDGTLTVTGSGTLASKNANTTATSISTLTGLGLSGTNAGNYKVASGTVLVTPVDLVLTPDAFTRVYDGSTTDKTAYSDTAGNYTFVGLQNGETVGSSGSALFLTGSMKFGGSNSTVLKNAGDYTQAKGSLALGGSGAGNYVLTFSNPHPNDYVITPADVTLADLQGTRVYDGGTDANGSILTIVNLASGDHVTITGSGILASKNVGKELITDLGTLKLTGADASNYTLADANPDDFVTVTQATLTVSALTQTKVYNGTATSTLTPTVAGLQTGDTTTGTLEQSYGSRNVLGTNGSTLAALHDIGVSDGNGGGNYVIVYKTAKGTITPEHVTVTATPNTKTYDGTETATATPTVTAGIIYNPDTGTFTESYSQKDVGTGLTLTPTGSIKDGNGGKNYIVTYVPISGTHPGPGGKSGIINPELLTISAVTQTKVYDGTTSSTDTPIITAGELFGGDTLTELSQAYNSRNVLGTNGSTLTVNSHYVLTDAGDYKVTLKTALGTITPEHVTVTATPNTKTYDGTDTATATPTVTAGMIFNPDTGTFTESYDTKNVGTGLTLTPTGTISDGNGGNNYIVTYVPISGSHPGPGGKSGIIDPATLTVSAVTQTRVYDGTAVSTLTPTVAGLQTGDTTTGTLEQSYGSRNVLGTNGSTLAALHDIGVDDGNGGGNYVIVYKTALGTITPEHVTVTATPNTKTYDGTDTATATPTVTAGIIYNPDTGTFTETYGTKDVGTGLTLTPTGTIKDGNSGKNYIVTYVPISGKNPGPGGKSGIINPELLTISAVTQTKVYDGTTTSTDTPIITAGELFGGDTLTDLAQAFNSRNVLGTNGSTLTINPHYVLTDAGDYKVTLKTALGTITPEHVTVTATPNTKTYDGTDTATATPTVTAGIIYNPDTGTFTETYSQKDVGTGLTLTPTGSIKDGNGGKNYIVTYVPISGTHPGPGGKSGIINPELLTISAVTQTKVYDGTTSSTDTPIITAGELFGGDTLTELSQAFNSRNVLGTNGSTLTVNAHYVLTDAGDYKVTLKTAKGTITPEHLTVTATPNTKTYDGTETATATPTLTAGVIYNPDTGTFTETYGTKNVGTGLTLTPTGTIKDGNGGKNYLVTYVPISGKNPGPGGKAGIINPELLTISAVTQTKVYDGTTGSTDTPIITAGELFGGDTLTELSQAFNSRNVLGTNGSTLTVNPHYVLTDAGDYKVTLKAAPGTITPLVITATGTRVYNGTPDVDGSILTITDLIPGDDIGITGTGTTSSPHVGTHGITGGDLTLTGTDAKNYTLTGGTETVKITPFAVVLTGTRVYDGQTDGDSGILSVTNAFGGDTVTVASGTSTIITRNVGNDKIVDFGTLTLGGASAGDYTLTGATGKVIVTPELLTVTAVPTSKPYDGTTTSPGTPIVTTGTIFGPDTGTFIQTYGNTGPGTGITLTPGGSVNDGNGGGNYVVTFVPVPTGAIIDAPPTAPDVTPALIPNTQTASGNGSSDNFIVTDSGLISLTPNQNGVVTGTIATIDGTDYQPDSQLGCTLGTTGCIQNGVAPTTTSAPPQ